jgi:hypothetical protein
VGVTSGGMDQAISMMGQQGVAMHVEFNPVRLRCGQKGYTAVTRVLTVGCPTHRVHVVCLVLAIYRRGEEASCPEPEHVC